MRLRTERGREIWLGLLVMAGGLAAWVARAWPASNPDRLWQQAEADFQAGRHDRAKAALTRLARLRAPTSLDWMLRAKLAMVQGRTDDALAALAKILDGAPMAPQARLLAGQLELRRYRMRPAEAWLLAALKLDPKLVQGHRELVYVYGMQMRRAALSAQFRALSELTPLSFENVFHWCLTRNATWEPVELSNILTRFIQADSDDRWSRLALVDSQRRLGRLDDAEKALATLPTSDPERGPDGSGWRWTAATTAPPRRSWPRARPAIPSWPASGAGWR